MASGGSDDNCFVSEEFPDHDYNMVAAIDFGTTYSGYAYSLASSMSDIIIYNKWGAEQGISAHKTPTCVLTNADGEFSHFGYEAENQYANLADGEDCNYSLFNKFKMELHRIKKLTKATHINATNGQFRPAIHIFTMALRYLKSHLIKDAAKQLGMEPDERRIRWVVTVPAIWSDASKQFMREAAFEAGLMASLKSSQLMIALEPEAASLWCRSLDVGTFVDQPLTTSTMRPGDKYLVLDAGGGTLDCTAHELLENGRVRELDNASGGALGSTMVDQSFQRLLTDVFSQEVMDAYKAAHPADWLHIISSFEQKKRAFKPSQKETTNIQLTYQFASVYEEVSGSTLREAFQTAPQPGVTVSNGMLRLSAGAMLELFAPCVEGIMSHVEGLLTSNTHLAGLSHILMVGGFSESPVLQQAMFSRFQGKAKVLVPHEASLCVIKGAVLFGHNPFLITTRVARKTYGIKCQRKFNPDKHDVRKRRTINGVDKAVDMFDPIIVKGEEVEIGTVKTVRFMPSRSDQRGADVLIYGTERTGVQYVTEPAVDLLAYVHVELAGEGTNRPIEVRIVFGGPEITVRAMDLNNPDREAEYCSLQFLFE